MKSTPIFISEENLNKQKQAQKGRGRGTSREREKGQGTSLNGRGKPLGEYKKKAHHSQSSMNSVEVSASYLSNRKYKHDKEIARRLKRKAKPQSLQIVKPNYLT